MYSEDYEKCYMTGEYDDQPCFMCPYRNECSGYVDNDEDDDQ